MSGSQSRPGLSRSSFLEQIQGIIERTYLLETGIQDVGSYIIGAEGLHHIYGEGQPTDQARLLLRADSSGRILARIYLPETVVRTLERHHPLRGLHADNVDAMGTLVEELDHLLLLADRAGRGTEASLLEMELQANITKALVARQLIARHLKRRLRREEKAWVHWHLLEKGRYDQECLRERRRYREARRLARKVLRFLDRMEPVSRLAWLRDFSRQPAPRRLKQADALPAA